MSAISTYLQRILNAIWAKDVRQAIHDAISQCYDDVNKPALQTEAMQAAVQAKIDAGEMAALTIADGSLTGAKLANGTITANKIASGVIPTTDTTLTQPGMPADAKAVGDEIASIEPGLSDEAKAALLACFEHVAWIDNQGQACYEELSSILTGAVTYKLGVNMSVISGSYMINYTNGNILYLNLSKNNVLKRRSFYVDDGIKPLNDGDGNPTDVYPISVPKNVTWAKAEITPSERQLGMYPVAYDSQNQKYVEHVNTDGYHAGEAYIALPGTDKDLYLAVFSRYDSSGSEYAAELTGAKITFGTRYSLGENMIVVNVNGTLVDGKIKLNTSLSTKRRTFFSTTGRETSYDASGNAVNQRYPIPLPLNVKTVTAKIEPASMYIALYILSYDESTHEYSMYIPTSGYEEGETEYEITGGHGELYALPVAKYNQAGDAFANEPTGMTIKVTQGV